MELVYQYFTGPRFRQRIEALVERFSDMQDDLNRERRTMMCVGTGTDFGTIVPMPKV